MGCDTEEAEIQVIEGVSIHAPVWGATPIIVEHIKASVVSIHAPVWGATSWHHRQLCAPVVSIHAPVWGATSHESAFVVVDWFQSTHPCGVRLASLISTTLLIVSIHAPVWGATNK